MSKLGIFMSQICLLTIFPKISEFTVIPLHARVELVYAKLMCSRNR